MDHLHRPAPGPRGWHRHRGRQQEILQSIWLSVGLFFSYSSPRARLLSVGSTLLHPCPSEVGWEAATKAGAGEGASKAAPADTAGTTR